MKTITVTCGIKAIRVVLWRREYDGPWYARWHVNGKLYRISTHQIMEREARAIARVEVEKSAEVQDSSRGLKLSTAAKLFLDQHEGKTEDTKHYRGTKGRIENLVEWYGDTNLSATDFEAAVDLIQKFLGRRREMGLSSTSLRNDRLALHAFFGWVTRFTVDGARVVGWPGNPCNRDRVLPARADERNPVPIPDSQIETIVRLAKETEAWPSVLLILGAGFRPVGVTRLLWKHVLFDQKVIVIQSEKNRGRNVPLNDWVADELRKWYDRSGRPGPEDHVLRVHSDTCHDLMRKLREDPANGLGENCTLQGLRVTADYRLYQSDVKPQKAAAIMGHLPSTAQTHYVQYELMDAHEDARHLDWSEEQKQRKTFPKTFPRKAARIQRRREVSWKKELT